MEVAVAPSDVRKEVVQPHPHATPTDRFLLRVIFAVAKAMGNGLAWHCVNDTGQRLVLDYALLHRLS